MVLSERRARILQFIIDDYVESAQPVGSKALLSRHDLGLSSATVRNEMAALEEEGMITHPHTSAGRIPSNLGYRYYVSTLMPERPLTRDEQMKILHQFHQSTRELEDWISLAASVLAHSMHSVGLATQPRLTSVQLKHLQLVEVSENRGLLVLVTNDAQVHQHTVEFAEPVGQERLSRIADRLNEELGGLGPEAFPPAETLVPSDSPESVIYEAVVDLLVREQASAIEVPVIEGIRELLRQPEYEDSDRVLDTLEAIEEHRLRQAIPSSTIRAADDVAIVIGDENGEGPYRNMSFVLTRYGQQSGPSGVLGILGPTRLAYGDAVSHIRYVRDLLSELLRQFYGEACLTPAIVINGGTTWKKKGKAESSTAGPRPA